jgi:ribosomal protein S6
MRTYEFVLILRPVQEKERSKILESVKSWLKDFKISNEKDWGSKALKYKIKKEQTGFYYSFNVEGDKISNDFEKKLLNTDVVLRHLLIRGKDNNSKDKN